MASVLFFDVVFWDSPPSHDDDAAREAAGLTDHEPLAHASENDRGWMLSAVNRFDAAKLGGMIGAEAAEAIVAARPEAGFGSIAEIDHIEGVGAWERHLLWAHAHTLSIPFIVLWLVFGAIFFTFRYGFVSIRAFKHAIHVTQGKFDDPDDPGEVSHFQALSSALSATVGLGNIAGVAVAVGVGGPGAVLWMMIAAFFGMSSKFSECTLGLLYRETDAKGNVSGGPMRYLDKGLAEMGLGKLGKVLSIAFAIMCVGGSFGGGNMFQANQSCAQIGAVVPLFADSSGKLIYGIVLALLVGAVIIGGIKRIGRVAELIVPFMCGVYVLAGVAVVVMHAGDVPMAFGKIFSEAFSPMAVGGGVLGVLVIGFQRAAFSNEAGVGSASIAHSAATTKEPVREGAVALLEPFIDTVVVCTMTGLVVVITGTYQTGAEGVQMTSAAFDTVIPGFKYVLTAAVVLFAYSTMISWSYYGERCFTFLFGTSSSMPYRVIFLAFTVLGSILELGNVITFSDLMILGMAFPNILGMILLSGKVRGALDDYWSRLKSGAMTMTKTKR
ncbi:MAG: alanine:cation symporter family protein [Sandaracinus sp.]|nr:alanine:cation symporter family protein [Sandaracinus sp.]MCB9611271.1 alanine:cation symporter family protein [Sandaracinus sp.]MCB9620332.1 alanine:cation symporter family protein [Sandaracinus sp.]MCB9633256.1 alanine:cation symporter family protein [Sandaracinus sp.]